MPRAGCGARIPGSAAAPLRDVAVPQERWPFPESERPDRAESWHPRFGDRLQQLVFIGQHMDEAAIRARLEACLLDESTAAQDSAAWSSRPNPFPVLQTDAESP